MDRLFNATLELEGLLRILRSRDDQDVRNLVVAKVKTMSELVSDWNCHPHAVKDEEKIDISDEIIEKYQNTASLKEDETTLSNQQLISEHNKGLDLTESVNDNHQPSVDKAIVIDNGHHIVNNDNMVASINDMSAETVRIEDFISKRESSDFSKVFNINDKFRFTRELFENSQVKFTETVNLVQAMESLDEAYDYFLNDLGWDPDNQDVSDFLSLVANHFNALT